MNDRLKAKTIILFFGFTLLYGNTLWAQDKLLNGQQLQAAKTYRSLNEALQNPEQVYKLEIGRGQLTTIPRSITQLKNLQSLTILGSGPVADNITQIPAYINELSLLQELDLTSNRVAAIPMQLTQLKHLKVLKLNHNNVAALPSSFSNLKALEHLDLSFTKVRRVSHVIALMPRLTYCSLHKTPTSFDELQKVDKIIASNRALLSKKYKSLDLALEHPAEVRVLDLSHQRINKLTPDISKLYNLEELNLAHNSLSELPPELAQLSHLRIIDFSYNQLQELPDWFFKLTWLDSLNLSGNKLESLPPQIEGLRTLKYLDLRYNWSMIAYESERIKDYLPNTDVQATASGRLFLDLAKADQTPQKVVELALEDIRVFPKQIVKYPNLQKLDFKLCELQTLPPEIGEMKKLKVLDLTRNHLAALPAEIGKLEDLRVLILENNRLTVLPPEIGRLKKLEVLDLRGNSLRELPAEIGQLENLRLLYLNGNLLEELPEELSNCRNLEELTINRQKFGTNFNTINHLPKDIARLEKLKKLNLSDNKITEKEYRRIKKALPKAKVELYDFFYGEFYSLQDARIEKPENVHQLTLQDDYEKFPKELFQYTNLIILDMSFNQLEEVPPEIARLKDLEELLLRENKLKDIPQEIGDLRKLRLLDVRDNKLKQSDIERIRAAIPDVEILH